ncbi:hypothetical protein B9Z19DRAFT_1094901 [Tuber borchii]|uniref:Secreted protein n=1 Tax=Tuber borchii TaxID=42251 RepID=A0A2T6ZDH4_TUBBO|nr:hypothetical protein B9Z19DRAFT_1094901 [Tuber borchii]
MEVCGAVLVVLVCGCLVNASVLVVNDIIPSFFPSLCCRRCYRYYMDTVLFLRDKRCRESEGGATRLLSSSVVVKFIRSILW